ncbi:unnamed protein product [Dicrocoelium dendriticum]|nr:unnamed protein product [Dicrocoelium dendriticum]
MLSKLSNEVQLRCESSEIPQIPAGQTACTTIGLKLPELRTRQCAAAASTSTGSALLRSNRFHTSKPCSASTSLKKELNATISSLQSEEHVANTPSSPLPCDLTVTLPIVDTTVHYAPRTSSPTPSMWTVAPRDRSINLTTLLPPDQEGPCGRRCMRNCSLCSCTISHLNGASPDACSCLSDTYAVCWASQSLSSHYPDTLASHDDRNSDHSASRCDSSPLPNTSPTSHSHSSLRVFLFNPIMLSTSLSEMASPYAADHFHTKTAYTDESRHENFVDLAHSPRTYHLLHNLHFVGVHPRFLSVLNYSPADVVGRNLLDLIHPDDLVSVAEALESVTEAKPMITTLHRLRCNSGGYRWSRLLAYVTTKTEDFRRPSAFTVDAEFPYNHEKTQVLVSKTSRPNSRSRPVISKPVSQITSYLDSRPPSPTYVPGCAALDHLPPKSSATCCKNSVDASPNTWILVCCHQFVHISTDTSPLNATFAITDAPTHEYHQVDASHVESHRPLKRRASLPTPPAWYDYAQILDSRDVHDSTAAYVPPLPHKSDQLDGSGPNEYTDFYRSHTSGQVTDPLCTLDNLDDELNGLTDVGARTWDRTEAHRMETNIAWPVESSFELANASMTKSDHPEASHMNKKDWVKQAPSVVPTLGDWNEINAPSGFRGPNSCAMIGASPANPNKTTFASNSEWSLSRSISSLSIQLSTHNHHSNRPPICCLKPKFFRCPMSLPWIRLALYSPPEVGFPDSFTESKGWRMDAIRVTLNAFRSPIKNWLLPLFTAASIHVPADLACLCLRIPSARLPHYPPEPMGLHEIRDVFRVNHHFFLFQWSDMLPTFPFHHLQSSPFAISPPYPHRCRLRRRAENSSQTSWALAYGFNTLFHIKIRPNFLHTAPPLSALGFCTMLCIYVGSSFDFVFTGFLFRHCSHPSSPFSPRHSDTSSLLHTPVCLNAYVLQAFVSSYLL